MLALNTVKDLLQPRLCIINLRRREQSLLVDYIDTPSPLLLVVIFILVFLNPGQVAEGAHGFRAVVRFHSYVPHRFFIGSRLLNDTRSKAWSCKAELFRHTG